MKERLDLLLVQKGFFESREKAKRVIMTGVVFADGRREDKAGTKVNEDAEIEVKGGTCPYVSRGGLKLAKAVSEFDIDLGGAYCADMGASTGGFTDCMLQNGAAKVYAMDVGYGQLDWKLRTDERVVNMEKTNIRYLDRALVEEAIDFVSIDVSFISLTLILPVAYDVMRDGGNLVCLVKPQFEAGRDQVGKKGIVKDKSVHREVIIKVAEFSRILGFGIQGITFSPMTGAKGNIEYLIYMKKTADTGMEPEEVVKKTGEVVEMAHCKLMNGGSQAQLKEEKK